MVCLAANQFLSYKDVAEKQNFMLRECERMLRDKSLQNVIAHVNKVFPYVYNARRVNLWVLENATGLLYTFSEHF
jgi:hypothetical protein